MPLRAKRPGSDASLVLRATVANLGLTGLVLALCLIGVVRPTAAQTDPWPTDPGQSAAGPGAPPPGAMPPDAPSPGAMPPDASPQSAMPPEAPQVDLPTQTEQSIAVLVNDDPISAYDIEQRERFLVITAHEKPGPDLKKKATDQLIDERLQMQQGKKLDVVADEADVTTILTEMAKSNNLTPEGLTNALAQMGINIKTLKDRLRAQLMWRDVVRRKFRHDVQIGDADVDKALSGTGATGEGSAAEGTALQLRQVKFEVPSNADQKTIAQILSEAEALRARFDSCANVADLAKGVKGASVNALADQAPTAISQPARMLVMNAKVGQMTPPTLSASTVELYAVCGKHSMKGDSKQREETEQKLVQQEMSIRAERFLRDVRQDAFIEYR
jgi:peptidyl-prolyl cis-trans isomerase SurA